MARQKVDKKSWSDLPREVQTAIFAAFFVAVGFGIVVPAIPVFARSFGVSHAAVGLIVSLFAVTRFSTGLFSGKLIDRFGERTIFATGVILVAVSVLLAGLAQSYTELLLWRAAGGIGSSMFSVSANSVILRSSTDENRGHAQSVYNGAFLVGGIAGPAIGGALMTISLRVPFFVYAASLLGSGLVAFLFLTPHKIGAHHDKSLNTERTTLRHALSLKPYRYALVISFVTSWVLFGLRSSILPLFVTEQLKSTTAVVGYGFTLSALVQGIFLLRAGRLSDAHGRRFALIAGSSIVIAGILALVFTYSPALYLIAMAILGLGGAFIGVAPATVVGDVIRGKGGQVIGLYQMAGDAGMMVGPIVVGFISDSYSYRTAFAVTAAIFSIAIILSLRMPETRKSHLTTTEGVSRYYEE